MIDVLITDDHPVVRQGIRQVLSESPEMGFIDEAADGKELLEKLEEHDFTVVLLDISLPGKNGLDVLREVKKKGFPVAVLMLSVHPENQYAVRSMKLGASGYLSKSTLPLELVEAVRTVANGKKYISPDVANIMANNLDKTTIRPLYQDLSDREFEVLTLLAKGKSLKDISEKMSLSPKTISTYRERILEKLHLHTTADIIRYALKEGLVD